MQKLLTFFNKNIRVYAIFNDQSFNDTLTNDILVLNNWALIMVKSTGEIRPYKAQSQKSLQTCAPKEDSDQSAHTRPCQFYKLKKFIYRNHLEGKLIHFQGGNYVRTFQLPF